MFGRDLFSPDLERQRTYSLNPQIEIHNLARRESDEALLPSFFRI